MGQWAIKPARGYTGHGSQAHCFKSKLTLYKVEPKRGVMAAILSHVCDLIEYFQAVVSQWFRFSVKGKGGKYSTWFKASNSNFHSQRCCCWLCTAPWPVSCVTTLQDGKPLSDRSSYILLRTHYIPALYMLLTYPHNHYIRWIDIIKEIQNPTTSPLRTTPISVQASILSHLNVAWPLAWSFCSYPFPHPTDYSSQLPRWSY